MIPFLKAKRIRNRAGEPLAYWGLPGILFVVVLLSSCGLPTTAFLAPPVLPATGFVGSEQNRILFFQHNPANDFSDFEGYDIWYKLYPTNDSGRQQQETDESAIEATPLAPGSGRLQNRGFRRIVALRRDAAGELTRFDDASPSVPLTPTSSRVQFELDLRPPFSRPDDPPSATAEITVTRTDTEAVLSWMRRRNTRADAVTEPEGDDGFFSFWNSDGYRSGQTDVYNALLLNFVDPTPDNLTIILYVITVGLDRSRASFSRFYSEPLRLFEAEILFP